jgi:hypothetical protein
MLEAGVKVDWFANTTELANAAAQAKHELAPTCDQVTDIDDASRPGPAGSDDLASLTLRSAA